MTLRSTCFGIGLVSILTLAPAAVLAVPAQLTVQGYLTGSTGGPAGDGAYALTLTLWDAPNAGAAIWQETQVGVSVVNGLFGVTLGQDTGGNPLTMPMFRDNAQLWLGIKIEAGPGVPVGGELELPRSPLTSVGFSFVADYATLAAAADTAQDVVCTACVSEAELTFPTATQIELDAVAASIPTSVDGMTGGTINGDLDVTGMLTVSGSVVCDESAGPCGAPSSRRWKHEIKPIEKPLDKVRRLEGVRFTWKENGRSDIGLIAEEVGKVVPEVVAYEENGTDARTVNYAHLTALLVEALKEQQAQIDELKQEVARLEGAR